MFVVYGLLIFFMLQNISRAVLLSGDIAEQTHKDEYIRVLKNNIQNTEKERTRVESLFVSEDSIVSFIEKVESLGNISSATVVFRSVSVEGEKNDRLKLDLSITGSFSEVFHFVILAEHLPFQASFDRMNILKLPKETKGDKWEALATLTLRSFRGHTETVNKKTP